MLDPSECTDAIGLLQAASLGGMPMTPEAVEAMCCVWSVTMSDLSADQLEAAAVAYLRTPDGKWWPTPGALRALAPAAARRRLEAPDLVLGPDDVEAMRRCGVELTPENWRWLRENRITFGVQAVKNNQGTA